MKVIVAFGTRPEAIKMAPLILELKKHKEVDVVICSTGQHREMLDQVLSIFNITPDYDLEIMTKNQTLFSITSSILEKAKDVLMKEEPDLVLVHGDTTSAFTIALAAFYLGIKVGHVEAGLRTYNLRSPFPEEFNRQAIGVVSELNFTPTELTKQNLLNEAKNPDSIFVTGNTVIDALKYTLKDDYTHPILEWVGDDKMILITAHRRENLGQPMRNMFNAIKRVLQEYPNIKVVYPIHKNPKVREIANEVFSSEFGRVKLIEPLEVVDFHNFMNKSFLILTDSGGVQEEAPSMGVPVLVMRDTTERPEGVAAGTLKLVGTEEENIYNNFIELMERTDVYNIMSNSSNPYGDGNASKKIYDIISKIYNNGGHNES